MCVLICPSTAGHVHPVLFGREDSCERKKESNYKKSGRAITPKSRRKLSGLRKGSEILLARPRPAIAGQLLAQTKAFDNLAIPIRVTTVKIIQQPPALVDHHDQPASRRMVLKVRLQMVDSLA